MWGKLFLILSLVALSNSAFSQVKSLPNCQQEMTSAAWLDDPDFLMTEFEEYFFEDIKFKWRNKTNYPDWDLWLSAPTKYLNNSKDFTGYYQHTPRCVQQVLWTIERPDHKDLCVDCFLLFKPGKIYPERLSCNEVAVKVDRGQCDSESTPGGPQSGEYLRFAGVFQNHYKKEIYERRDPDVNAGQYTLDFWFCEK